MESREEQLPLIQGLSGKAALYHSRVPYLRKLPFKAVAIIVALLLGNLIVWAAVAIIIVRLPRNCLAQEY